MDDISQQSTEDRDPNVYSFMMQLVQEKHGEDVEFSFLEQEAGRLYDIFGEVLLNYFEPQLTPDQKVQFDQLVEAEAEQDQLLNFLIENIGNLEQQIVQILANYRSDYLSGKLELPDNQSAVTPSLEDPGGNYSEN